MSGNFRLDRARLSYALLMLSVATMTAAIAPAVVNGLESRVDASSSPQQAPSPESDEPYLGEYCASGVSGCDSDCGKRFPFEFCKSSGDWMDLCTYDNLPTSCGNHEDGTPCQTYYLCGA